MNTTIAASIRRRNRFSQIPSFLRCISSESTDLPPPPSSPFRRIDSSFTQKVLSLLQTNDINNNDELHHLLFPPTDSDTPLDPYPMVQIARSLRDSSKAFQFFEYLRTKSPSPPNLLLLSSIYQSIFELASRERPNSQERLSELFDILLNYRIPLTINSATLLIRTFGEAGMASKSLLVYNELDSGIKNTHVRNALLKVLLNSDKLDYALQVLDEMLEPNTQFPPNECTMDIVVTSFLRRDLIGTSPYGDEIMKIIQKLIEHGLFPPMLTSLMNKLCRNSKSKQALDILAKTMVIDGNVKATSCNILLNSLSKQHRFQEMNLLMADMKEKGVQPDAITFGILINHLCKFHRMNEAMDVFERMQTEGNTVKPDAIIFNTLINGLCKVGKQEDGLDLLTKMKSERIQPTAATYNCLIDGFCKVGEMDKAFELFETMKIDGVEPNVITLNTLVDGLCKHGRVHSALEFLGKNSTTLKPNAVTYSILIKAFCNVNNIEKALTIYNDMLKAECSPDRVLYFTLISGLTLAGRLNDASSIASKMKQSGFPLDITAYNTLIGGFCRKNQREKAYEMLEDMEKTGVKPDVITYNTLMSFLSKIGDLEKAGAIMKKMKSEGLEPTVVTYGTLIHAYCLEGNLNEAMKIFKHISSSVSKVPPNTVVYNILIDSLCKNDEVEKAISLMDDMKIKQVRPNTATFNAILKGVYGINCLEKGFEIMDMMIETSCCPDYVTMEILTNWLPNVGQSDKLKRFVRGFDAFSSTDNQV
ncbi:pentatricopeptide repeat-containing protein At3g61520, mitochondrial-like [Impatiens glandulifera]|uniref:pentatricopeptide repeat-containing protein At3g61520, mitochondrial-like n=1 Tax=Impatiens glandulifera TaxID=253017 RepID=UPI001FB15FAE|nr:pentatricopeptide repeat-containing protein At3g61520, mitochondrial-like [Impatiens glandulifera]